MLILLIDPLHVLRPFCASVLRCCWFGYVACKIVPEKIYYVSGGMLKVWLNATHSGTHSLTHVDFIYIAHWA